MSFRRTYSFVSEPPEEYLCRVCATVLQEPHLTECCGQYFCRICLESWFEKSQGRGVCPHCREVDFVHIVSKPLQRKINKLSVFCPNRDKGCKVTVNLGELRSHLSCSSRAPGCAYVPIPCKKGCSQVVLRGEMDLHLKKCPFRIEACTYCKAKMIYDSLNRHYTICKEYKSPCPMKCGQVMHRTSYYDHQDTCPNMPVKCPFYDAGCNDNLMRKEIDEHVEKNTNSHLTKVMSSFSVLKASVKAIKKEFAEFKSQAAVEVTRMKKVIDKPTHIVKSLECMQSLLRGCRLNSDGDKMSFSTPPDYREWRSPSFIISPGYTFSVGFNFYETLSFGLILLRGEADDDLEWPMRINSARILCISLHCTDLHTERQPEDEQISIDINSLDIQRCSVGDEVIVCTQIDLSLNLYTGISISLEK